MDRHANKIQSLPRSAAAASPRDTQFPLRLSDGERAVLAALREIAYGQVEVVVHSSRIVQITRSQRVRVDSDRRDRGAVDSDPGHVDGIHRDAD